MTRRIVRCCLLLAVLALPGCLVVTCGDTRTFPSESSTESRGAGRADTAGRTRSGSQW